MLRATLGAFALTRGAPITHEHDEHPPGGDEELHSQPAEQNGGGQSTPGAVQDIPSDEFALVDAYGCLPPAARWLEARETEPVECLACGKVYFGSLYDLLDAHFEKSPDRAMSHDCEPHEDCWGWWARHRVHGRAVRSGGWRARHRRDGCGYRGRGDRRLGAKRLRKEGGCT